MTNQPTQEQQRSGKQQESHSGEPSKSDVKEKAGPVRPETQNPDVGANPAGGDAHQGHQGPR